MMTFDGVGKDFALQPGIYKSQVGLKFELVRIRCLRLLATCGRAMMRHFTSFVVFLAMVIGTAVSKPLWSTVIDNNDVHSTPEINAQYLAAYQDSPYYAYNIYTNAGGIPSSVHVSGKPEVSYIPAYNVYYGTPIYNIRIPLNPIYPVLTPSHPGGAFPPVLPPTSTQEPPSDGDYDGIEKLDTKVEPATETKKPGNNGQDDDSITVEAI